MAGTLTISTLSDGTNSTSSTNCIQGSAKAWVIFNGVTTATVRASYNVSSVTRASTGVYTITMTNALSDANYVTVASFGNAAGQRYISATSYNAAPTTSVITVASASGSNSLLDADYASVAIFR